MDDGEASAGKHIHIRRLLGIAILLVAGGIIYYLFSPGESSLFPKCPFHTITGLDCPGCGSQRAVHHLLHLQIKDAFTSNPLLIVAIPYILTYTYLEYLGGKEKYPRVRQSLYSRKAIYAVLLVIILFWIGRNLI
ncbi:MAG: DUF2752 domain-containing protein [Dysgonomonas sp.]|jgi:hypothetical protein|uniref:DUF2752 domain-containing protein n=1 Tax=unclassified Dysgonomonas TaxID=2630389 RepID=UPI0025C60EBA|nr:MULTISPECIES: DUF2752 domain-containing protein [unclassified Dysgonomonas]MDR1715372.1 DUF2752 domain-containing protein [Prevotella sp.]MDR2004935.1 DUF2752 domain-containing protein [Prevotella sp.]HMM01651.1 DUF2752 domain-containing protein [Dysgonomonas sp.]